MPLGEPFGPGLAKTGRPTGDKLVGEALPDRERGIRYKALELFTAAQEIPENAVHDLGYIRVRALLGGFDSLVDGSEVWYARHIEYLGRADIQQRLHLDGGPLFQKTGKREAQRPRAAYHGIDYILDERAVGSFGQQGGRKLLGRNPPRYRERRRSARVLHSSVATTSSAVNRSAPSADVSPLSAISTGAPRSSSSSSSSPGTPDAGIP